VFKSTHQKGTTGYLNTCIKSNTIPLVTQCQQRPWKQKRCFHLSPVSFSSSNEEEVRCRLHSLVRAYRTHGHIEATLDPLGLDLPKKGTVVELKPSVYHLDRMNIDQDTMLNVDQILHIGPKTKPMRQAALKDIIKTLNDVYCNNVAAVFSHLESTKEILWLANQLESTAYVTLTDEEKKYANKLLQESEVFDHFLAKKFPGTKRYGLEGAESMIPALDALFHELNHHGVTDVVIGMPHRGRLNVLTGLLNFPPRAIFHKIKGNLEIPSELYAVGDVLSHLGISTTLNFDKSSIHVSLLNNPSHLEAINPVAMGKTRAKRLQGKNTACVLIHGDAAFCGQGIVPETFNLANLPYFTTDGTVHIILNNQLGFTTPALHYKSSRYSGDVGKMVGAPILAVNGEKLDDVIRVVRIAANYRHLFKKDIIVELVAFRKHGHNELDSADFTQPKMYKTIKARDMFPKIYARELCEQNLITKEDVLKIRNEREEFLEQEYRSSDSYQPEKKFFLGDWEGIQQAADFSKLSIPVTGVDINLLKKIAKQSVTLPESFHVHQRLKGFHIARRIQMIEKNEPIDWATAEVMAFGSLLVEGYNVRLSGQDVARGTFSQRHLEFVDQETEERYTPLQHLEGKKGYLEVVTSPLSELAVLGFEYGYSINNPYNFVVWEAQFGDFWPNAQTIVDQFISSGEDKWCLSSGITLMLPHGMDGAGPEHSSSRIERFLQMCDSAVKEITTEGIQRRVNMCVVNPTTPANYFHALRRQMKRTFRKPLILISPKTLLKKREAVSPLEDFTGNSKFQCVLPDTIDHTKTKGPKRIMFCSGKIFYDLAEKRASLSLDQDIAILRLEQLSPFPFEELERELKSFNTSNVKDWMWVQEEHENQGAYLFAAPRIENLISVIQGARPGFSLKYVGREPAAVSAVGYKKLHEEELQKFMNEAFTGL
jgi:probable 2-oxoglutarate dehydrogenase E1 component DHKTD1